MAAQYDISITAGIDPAGVKRGTKEMERDTKAFARGAEMEFRKVEKSQARLMNQAQRGGRGGKGGFALGQAAMQIQDISVQAQAGARATTIIAQQGSQIASAFGPIGMLVGAVIALGAALYDVASGAQEAEAKASRLRDTLQKMMAANVGVVGSEVADDQAIAVLNEEIKRGKEAAQNLERRIALENKLRDIRNSGASPGVKEAAMNSAQDRFDAEERLRQKQRDRERRTLEVETAGKRILDRANEYLTPASERSAARSQERRERRAIRRAAESEVNAIDADKRRQAPFGRTSGLTRRERQDMIDARVKAAEIKKNGLENVAKIEQKSIDDLVEAIGKLLTK